MHIADTNESAWEKAIIKNCACPGHTPGQKVQISEAQILAYLEGHTEQN